MTAAHCCVGQSADDVKIVAGEHNLFEDEGLEQVRRFPGQPSRVFNFFGFYREPLYSERLRHVIR